MCNALGTFTCVIFKQATLWKYDLPFTAIAELAAMEGLAFTTSTINVNGFALGVP